MCPKRPFKQMRNMLTGNIICSTMAVKSNIVIGMPGIMYNTICLKETLNLLYHFYLLVHKRCKTLFLRETEVIGVRILKLYLFILVLSMHVTYIIYSLGFLEHSETFPKPFFRLFSA